MKIIRDWFLEDLTSIANIMQYLMGALIEDGDMRRLSKADSSNAKELVKMKSEMARLMGHIEDFMELLLDEDTGDTEGATADGEEAAS